MIVIGGILATGKIDGLRFHICGARLRTDEPRRDSFEWSYYQWHVLDDDGMHIGRKEHQVSKKY